MKVDWIITTQANLHQSHSVTTNKTILTTAATRVVRQHHFESPFSKPTTNLKKKKTPEKEGSSLLQAFSNLRLKHTSFLEKTDHTKTTVRVVKPN